MMRKLIDQISSNGRQIIEILALVTVAIILCFVNLPDIFKKYLGEYALSSLGNFFWRIAIMRGKYIESVFLFFAVLIAIRKFNHDFIMNRKLVYHDYSYVWYWICAKILGIKSCDLVLVPIHMQFKLVIRATFSEYPLDEKEYPVDETEADIKVSMVNRGETNGEINLILEDTYTIDEKQIPKTKLGLRTIKVSRNNGNDNTRHFSPKFIDKITNVITEPKGKLNVNIYATTNPMNTKHIAKRIFGLGERGNVEHLYVFQQRKDGRRHFDNEGKKIY